MEMTNVCAMINVSLDKGVLIVNGASITSIFNS